MNWYCFRTTNKKEKIATENVRKELGLEAFCPMISKVKKCYSFAQFDIDIHLQDFRYIRDVNKVLTLGSRIPAVPDDFILELRAQLDINDTMRFDEPSIELTTDVRIDNGPLRDFVGRMVRASDSGDRIYVLLDLLGHRVEVKLSSSQVSPVGAL